jgi:flagellar protein FliS
MTDKVFEDRMRTNPYQAYVEDEILTADPIKLVQILYRGAMEAVFDARAQLARRDIKGRSAAVTKAVEILAELSSSLDHERGGELSAHLAALYDFAQRRLLAGNQEQVDGPLAEAERVLKTLEEAWTGLEVAGSAKPIRSAGAEHAPDRSASQEYVPLSCAC